MKRLLAPAAAVVTAVALIVLSSTPSASAHERRTVAGNYTFVVGFINEPALLEEPNGIDLRVSNAQTNDPVEGVEKTLKVDVSVGGQTKTMDLRARFGQKGAYTADLFPTKPGTWVFRFYGTLEGVQVDERFESGPGRFNDVQAKADIAFPSKVPSIGELAVQAQKGGQPAEAAATTGSPSPDVQRALDKADDARKTGITFGVIGIVVGLLGIAVGAYALISPRGTSGPPARGEPA